MNDLTCEITSLECSSSFLLCSMKIFFKKSLMLTHGYSSEIKKYACMKNNIYLIKFWNEISTKTVRHAIEEKQF